MRTPYGAWRATYTKGEWVVLSGPTSMVIMRPASPAATRLVDGIWEKLLASVSITELSAELTALGLGTMPDLAVFFWDDDLLRCLVRGRVRVQDADSGELLASGEGARTWYESTLKAQQIKLELDEAVADDLLRLPLVVGAVQASTVVLDVEAPDQGEVEAADDEEADLSPVVVEVPAEPDLVVPNAEPQPELAAAGLIAATSTDLIDEPVVDDAPVEQTDDEPAAVELAQIDEVDAAAEPAEDELAAEPLGDPLPATEDFEQPVELSEPEAADFEQPVEPSEPEAADFEQPVEPSEPEAADLEQPVEPSEPEAADFEPATFEQAIEPEVIEEPAPAADVVAEEPVENDIADQPLVPQQFQVPTEPERPVSPPRGGFAPAEASPSAEFESEASQALPDQPTPQAPSGLANQQFGQGAQGATGPWGVHGFAGAPVGVPMGDDLGVASAYPTEPEQPVPTMAEPARPVGPHQVDSGDHDGETVFTTGIAATHKPSAGRNTDESLVLAAVCPLGHPNAPGASQCRVCGGGVDSHNPQLVNRPVLAIVTTSAGDQLPLVGPILVGRAPTNTGNDLDAELLRVPSPNHDISRTHLRIAAHEWSIEVSDLYSTNGTIVIQPNGQPIRLESGQTTEIEVGGTIDLGDGQTILLQLPN